MNRVNYDTHYGAAEILQYLSGKMDREQTRMLERALLDDDFLAEAIEGYRLMRITMSDDAILGKLVAPVIITTEKKQAAVISIKPLFKWVGYAAAASLVLSGGWWILNTTQPNQEILPVPSYKQDSVSEIAEGVIDNAASNPTELVKTAPVAPAPEESTTEDLPATNKENDIAKKTYDAPKPTPIQPSVKNEAELNEAIVASKIDHADAQSQRKARALVAPQPIQNIDSASMDMAAETVSSKNAMTRKIPVVIVPADTLNAFPVNGWSEFKDNIKKDLAANPLPLGSATITIYANGSLGEIVLKEKFSAAETQQIEKWFREGSGWINKTQTTTRVIISWH